MLWLSGGKIAMRDSRVLNCPECDCLEIPTSGCDFCTDGLWPDRIKIEISGIVPNVAGLAGGCPECSSSPPNGTFILDGSGCDNMMNYTLHCTDGDQEQPSGWEVRITGYGGVNLLLEVVPVGGLGVTLVCLPNFQTTTPFADKFDCIHWKGFNVPLLPGTAPQNFCGCDSSDASCLISAI
jgi:hypothetical protein